MIKKITRREILLVLGTSIALIAVLVAALFHDTAPEWKYFQSEFRLIVAERVADVDPAILPSGIQQIWVDELDRVDRCTTCHIGMGDAEAIPGHALFGAHPPIPHEVRDLGCVSCHQGQGRATTKEAAHATAEELADLGVETAPNPAAAGFCKFSS